MTPRYLPVGGERAQRLAQPRTLLSQPTKVMLACLVSSLLACQAARNHEAGSGATFACSLESLAEGNSSVTGLRWVDDFFRTSQALAARSSLVEARLAAQLSALTSELELTPEEIDQAGSAGLAITAKLVAELGAELVVETRSPRCHADARASFEALRQCLLAAGCRGIPAEAPYACIGTCSVPPENPLSCGDSAIASCSTVGSDLPCAGDCIGTCVDESDMARDCPGACSGICQGNCSLFGDANGDGTLAAGECVGKCKGVCEGVCSYGSELGIRCRGRCSGECVSVGGALDCSHAERAACSSIGDVALSCSGECAGSFRPPSAEEVCEASSTCSAQTKTDAILNLECDPSVVSVALANLGPVVTPDQARLDFVLARLRSRLPQLLQLRAQAELLLEACDELTSAAAPDTSSGALLTFAEAVEDDASSTYRLRECAPEAFATVEADLGARSTALAEQLAAATSVLTGLVNFR